MFYFESESKKRGNTQFLKAGKQEGFSLLTWGGPVFCSIQDFSCVLVRVFQMKRTSLSSLLPPYFLSCKRFIV
jgi:hypothetical protein